MLGYVLLSVKFLYFVSCVMLFVCLSFYFLAMALSVYFRYMSLYKIVLILIHQLFLRVLSVYSKITKILNSDENQIEMSLTMAKSNDKTHQKWMNNNCHIPDLVQAFSNVENSGLNIVIFIRHIWYSKMINIGVLSKSKTLFDG